MADSPDQLKQTILNFYEVLDDVVNSLEDALTDNADLSMGDIVLDYEIDDSALLHRDPDYDPVKAHEYYIRTRKLKGRQVAPLEEKTSRPKRKTSPEAVARKERVDNLFERLQNLPETEARFIARGLENYMRSLLSLGRRGVQVPKTLGKTGIKIAKNSPPAVLVKEIQDRLNND